MSILSSTLLFPVLLIGVIQWSMPSLVPLTVPFGVRIPAARANEPVIAEQRRRYRFGIAAVTVIMSAAVLLAADRPVVDGLAVGAELVASLVLYLLARSRITAVKAREDWFGGLRQVTIADTSLRTDPERFPWLWIIPSVALLAATTIWGIVEYPRMPARLATHFGASGHADHYAAKSIGSAFGLVLVQALMTALVLSLTPVLLRSGARLDAEDPQATLRHRRFVSAMARALQVLAACVNVTLLFGALVTWKVITSFGLTGIAMSALPSLLGTVVVLVVAFRTGQGGSRLRLDSGSGSGTEPAGGTAGRAGTAGTAGPAGAAVSAGEATVADGGVKTVNRDDDRLYRWGVVYFNPDDPTLFVPKRFGIGWTVNMGRPLAWVLFAATVAVIAFASLVGSHHH
jgi:uncharacterized membrane protein